VPRVYVEKGVDAPESDGHGGYYQVVALADLVPLVGRLGAKVKEIVLTGRPSSPLDPRVTGLGTQIVSGNGAWGVRNTYFFQCRGASLDAVLKVREKLAYR